MKAAAAAYALSDRANAGRVAVVEFGVSEPSTKAAVAALAPITGNVHHRRLSATTSTSGFPFNIPTVHPISSISSTRTT